MSPYIRIYLTSALLAVGDQDISNHGTMADWVRNIEYEKVRSGKHLPVFRPGSGAVVTLPIVPTSPSTFLNFPLKYFPLIGMTTFIVFIVMHMVPGNRGSSGSGNNRDYQYRIPPTWSPENEPVSYTHLTLPTTPYV